MSRTKILLGTLACAAAFSATALANGGSYVDACDDYQPVASEYAAGFYVGIQGGYASDRWSDLDSVNDIAAGLRFDSDDGGFGARIFAGYDFNECFGVEMGYTYLNGTDQKIYAGNALVYNDTIKTHAIDLVGKFKIPLDNGFGIYTKLGAVYLGSSDAPKFAAPIVKGDDRSTISVAFGAGVYYHFTSNFYGDLSWTHYRGCSEVGNDFQPDVDFFAIGLGVKFPA